MAQEILDQPDKHGIITALPDNLSAQNIRRMNKFGSFMFLYDFIQDHFVRPRLHKADPQRHRQILKKVISSIKNSRVLDIACGTGNALPYFHSSNEYTGLDLSYPMLRQAVKKVKNKSLQKIIFIQGTAEELLFDDESFEFVLMDTALHMIPDYQPAIAEIARVLTKGGIFVCSTPAMSINKKFDITWEKISEKRNLHALTPQKINKVCSLHGLTYGPLDTNGGVLYFQARKAI